MVQIRASVITAPYLSTLMFLIATSDCNFVERTTGRINGSCDTIYINALARQGLDAVLLYKQFMRQRR